MLKQIRRMTKTAVLVIKEVEVAIVGTWTDKSTGLVRFILDRWNVVTDPSTLSASVFLCFPMCLLLEPLGNSQN